MTSSANDDWNHYDLTMTIHLIERQIRFMKEKHYYGELSNATTLDIKSLEHGIDFIKYNMEQAEIIGGNGD